MKFWHKVLLIVLIIFIATLDISIFTIMQKNWALNLSWEIERASSEQALIANNIYENLNSVRSRGSMLNEDVYYDVVRSYDNYYSKQGIALEMWKNNRRVFPLNGEMDSAMPAFTSRSIERNGNHIIQIAKYLPSPDDDLLLLYERNINSLFAVQQDLNHFFVIINLAMGLCLMVLLYCAIRHLTKPLLMLSETTKQIADGNYVKRVALKSKDEFGELADNFNRMAEAVERHVTELLHMAEEKQRLADNLAHELRTPLTGMKGFADYLMTANCNEEERLIAAGYIQSETLRLNQLANKLLEISDLKHESCPLKPVSIEHLFDAVTNIEEPQLRLANQTLITNRSVSAVMGDFDLLVSFLVNCIDNAIHASGENDTIVLSAYEENHTAVLEVRDEGCGMSMEQTKNAFEAFYRSDKSRSREHGGAGLGLSLCKHIAESLDAKLNLYSKMNEGTKIQIILQLSNNFTVTP